MIVYAMLFVSANSCQTHHVTLLTLTLEVMALVPDMDHRASSMYQVLKLVGLLVRKILGIYCVNINGPGDLDL